MEKYVKKFENFINEAKVDDDLMSMFSSFDKFRHSLINHRDYESSVLVAVYVGEEFKKDPKTGQYDMMYEPLTNIMKITPDKSSHTSLNMMALRGKTQDHTGLMVLQWIDKNMVDDMIEEIRKDWRSEEGQFYLKTIVNHYKEHSLGKGRRG